MLLLLVQICPGDVVFAADEADSIPTGQTPLPVSAQSVPAAPEQMLLTVPERFRDGGNWFFVPEQGYAAGETSEEKICIPIQRTGDLETEAGVVLKITDISARHDVNYTAEIYKQDVDPAVIFDDISIVDLIRNADGQEEYEPVADENEFGELVNAAGGAQIVDKDGNVLGNVTATPLDENGKPIQADAAETEDPSAAAQSAAPSPNTGTAEASGETSGTAGLRAARDAFTGTVSDRQELEGGDLYDFNAAETSGMTDMSRCCGPTTTTRRSPRARQIRPSRRTARRPARRS